MANLTCGASGVGACAIRVTRLNCDGSVDYDNPIGTYTTCRFTTISLTPVTRDGEETFVRNACGGVCVDFQTDPTVSGWTLDFDKCDLDAEFEEIIGANNGIITDGAGDTVGGQLAGGTASCDCASATVCGDVALEFWVRAVNCDSEVGYFRYTIPKVKLTAAGQALAFTNATLSQPAFTGRARANALWPPEGPAGDYPTGVTTDGASPSYFFETTLPVGLDPNVCGYTATGPDPTP